MSNIKVKQKDFSKKFTCKNLPTILQGVIVKQIT